MIPCISRGMEVSLDGHATTPESGLPGESVVDNATQGNQYGDLIRNLLMTSCSAPVDPQMDVFRRGGLSDAGCHHRYAVSAVDVPHMMTYEPPSCRPSVVVALGHPSSSSNGSYWFAATSKEVDEETASGPPSVQILSPPPSPSADDNMDVATRLQIDEFEELIEKIDRLNDMQTEDVVESSPSLADLLAQRYRPSSRDNRDDDSPSSSSSAAAAAAKTSADGPPSFDNDLETLLEENPSLLDIPGVGLHVDESSAAVTREGDELGDSGLKCNMSSTGFASDRFLGRLPCVEDDAAVDDGGQAAVRTNVVPGSLTSPVPTRFFGPPTSLKSATMTTRTNLKQLLQMQQFHEMERKDQSKHTTTAIGSSSVVNGPPTVSSSVSVPMQPILPSRMEVPSEVLKVHSRLENPTRYHVEENQKRQVKQYLSTTHGNARSILVHSVPNTEAPSGKFAAAGCSAPLISSSAPSPDSPNSVLLSSSAATSVTSEADVIESIMQLESSMDVEHAYLSQTSATHPTSANFMDVLKLNSANSCPADVPLDSLCFTDNQLHALAKDRQKKDNHNMIERRRRFNINDRIKELGTLLPRSSDPYYDMVRVDRQNKGTILKATVDYVKQMKRELERMKLELTEKDHENRKLRLQNVQLSAMQSHSNSSSGVDVNWSESLTAQSSSVASSAAIFHPKEEHRIKEEPTDVAIGSCDHSLLGQQMSPYDDLMDEDEPVHNDPMLSSSMLGNTI